jgi:hypothetical protein
MKNCARCTDQGRYADPYSDYYQGRASRLDALRQQLLGERAETVVTPDQVKVRRVRFGFNPRTVIDQVEVAA